MSECGDAERHLSLLTKSGNMFARPIVSPYNTNREILSHTSWVVGYIVLWQRLAFTQLRTTTLLAPHYLLPNRRFITKSIMSPSKKRKGSGKSRRSRKSAAADDMDDTTMSSAVNVEMGAKAVAGIDQYMKNFNSLQQKAQNALIGYARTDVIGRELAFGTYNQRQLNNVEKKTLLDSFNENGLDRFNVNHAIPLILSAASVDKSTVTKLSSITFENVKPDGSHLPLLRLRTDPPADANGVVNFKDLPKILAAGGRHRCAALDEWIAQRQALVSRAAKALREMQAREKSTEDAPTEEELSRAQEALDHAMGLVKMGGSWIVALYDEGECATFPISISVPRLTWTSARARSRRQGARHSSVHESTPLRIQGDRRRRHHTDVHHDESDRQDVGGLRGPARQTGHAGLQDRPVASARLRVEAHGDDRRHPLDALHTFRHLQDLDLDLGSPLRTRRGECLVTLVGRSSVLTSARGEAFRDDRRVPRRTSLSLFQQHRLGRKARPEVSDDRGESEIDAGGADGCPGFSVGLPVESRHGDADAVSDHRRHQARHRRYFLEDSGERRRVCALRLRRFEVDGRVPDVYSGGGGVFAVDRGEDGERRTVVHGLCRHEESVGELRFEGEARSSDEVGSLSGNRRINALHDGVRLENTQQTFAAHPWRAQRGARRVFYPPQYHGFVKMRRRSRSSRRRDWTPTFDRGEM